MWWKLVNRTLYKSYYLNCTKFIALLVERKTPTIICVLEEEIILSSLTKISCLIY
jgi:hypothetical protein